MGKLVFSAVGFVALGYLANSNQLMGIGGILFLAWAGWHLLIGARKGIAAGTRLAVDKVKERQAEKREEREYQKQLRREMERIETVEKARASQQLELYRKQIDILAEYKKKEGDITAELLAMRQKLLVLESQENAAMVQNLIQTLDAI